MDDGAVVIDARQDFEKGIIFVIFSQYQRKLFNC